MKKSSKICKKDKGVAILLEDGGGIGFENKLWDNVTKRSMKKGGNLESLWVVEIIVKNSNQRKDKVEVLARNYSHAKRIACDKKGYKAVNYDFNIYQKMAKGLNVEGLYEYDSINYEQKNDYEKGQLVVIRNEDLGKDIITKITKTTKDSGGKIYSTVDGGDYYYTQILGIVVNRMTKGGGLNKSSDVDVEDIKSKMYNWFTAWLGNFISDEELVNSLKRKLGTKWFRFFKGDTMASDWQSVQNSMKTKNNREFLKENMQIALDDKSLEIYNSKGVKLAKGGSLESELPSDTEQLVKDGKVTYRGMGFGASGVKLKVKGKEYIVSDEKFKALGGISKIKFDAPFRQFGKGTTIEGSEVSLHLPVEMSVYVPSTKDANVPVSKSELLKRVNEVKEYLANLFGGYSSSEVVGGYVSNEGSLIQEDVVKVISFATKKAYEENKQKLINKIANWSTLWSQEAIGFELEGDLYYINQDKKMSKGGALKSCGCHKKMSKGGNTDCGCWHYEIGGL